eukprot:Skav219935  [mRNA]  locus=scaffold1807:61008:61469:- [translate_table: standard]
MGGQAVWSLACLFGSRLASAAPMAAKCAWEEGAWKQVAKILSELGGLPVWTYAGKDDDGAVCWRDLWWLAKERNKETQMTKTTTATHTGIQATIHAWSADLSVTLVDGGHCIWDPVYHFEDAFQLFSRMLQARCRTPPSIESAEARFPAASPG